MTRGPVLLAAIAALSAAIPAAAQQDRPPARVTFVRTSCKSTMFDAKLLESLVQVELSGDVGRELVVVDLGARLDPALLPTLLLWMEGACGDTAAVTIHLSAACPSGVPSACDAAARVSRRVSLSDVPESARARTLAIAFAELVRSSEGDLAAAPAASVAPAIVAAPLPFVEKTKAALPRPLPPRMPRPAIMFGASGEVLSFFPRGGTFVGARLDAAFSIVPSLRLHVGARAAHADASDAIGDVDGLIVTAGAGLGLGVSKRVWAADVGPEIEAGVVRASGTPSMSGVRGSVSVESAVLAAVRGSGRLRLSAPVWAVLDVAVGGTLKGVVAKSDERSPLAVRNAALRVALGVALEL